MTYSTQSNIPIELMPGIGERTARVLKKMEIKTIGQFQNIPEKILVELFGTSILKFHTTKSIKIKKPAKTKFKTNWQKMIYIFILLVLGRV